MDKSCADAQLAGGIRIEAAEMSGQHKMGDKTELMEKNCLTYPANLGRVRDTIATGFLFRAT